MGTRETLAHGGLSYLPLLWTFGPGGKTSPPSMTPVLLHLPLFPASYINMQLTCYMLIFHCVSQLISSELLIFSCLYVFCLFRQKTGWAPVIKSLSLHQSEGKLLPPGSQENLTFRSPTHTHWMAVLSPVQIWKREKDIASEGGWGRVKWKDIPVFGCRVGRRKEYEAAEQTSTAIGLHLCALHFSSVCFLS